MPFKISTQIITRETVQKNPDKIFIFGDNYERTGNGGQAAACRGMKNCVGLATKHSPGGAPEDYFEETPEDIGEFCKELMSTRQILEGYLSKGTTVIWLEGIGMGLAGLQSKPIYVFLINQLKEQLRNYKP